MAVKRLLLLSGAMGSGKSSIATVLKEKYFFSGISSGAYLRKFQKINSLSCDRLGLQELGDQLDIETGFSWLIDLVAVPAMESASNVENWLLDAVRKPRQVDLFRLHFVDVVKHIHLIAPESVLKNRYLERDQNEAPIDYEIATHHPNELAARSLASIADQKIDTSRYTQVEIAEHILNMWKD